MTAQQSRWAEGPAGARPPAAADPGGSVSAAPAAEEPDGEWDAFTRLILLLEISGRRSWLEGIRPRGGG